MMKSSTLTIDPRKILIVKPSSLGDIVHSLPFLNAIKLHFPKAEVHWVVAKGFEGLLDAHPMIDRLWVIHKDTWKKIKNVKGTISELRTLSQDLKRENYDLVVDLQGLLRSGVITAATGARIRIGFKEAREGSGFFYTHKIEGGRDIHAVDRYLKIAECLGCDVSQVSFPFPEFTDELVAMLSQLSFPQVKRVGNPSLTPSVPLRLRGMKGGYRASRNARLTTESASRHDSPCDISSAFKDYVVIVPGARWTTKRWPPEKFGRLASLLPLNSVVVGSKSDKDIADEIVSQAKGKAISLAGKTTLKELVEIVRGAKFVITNDSGPMHIAAALGIPVFAIFGPTDPQRTGPYGKGHTVIKAEVPCAPCFKKKCDDMRCMKNLSTDKVFEIVKSKQPL